MNILPWHTLQTFSNMHVDTVGAEGYSTPTVWKPALVSWPHRWHVTSRYMQSLALCAGRRALATTTSHPGLSHDICACSHLSRCFCPCMRKTFSNGFHYVMPCCISSHCAVLTWRSFQTMWLEQPYSRYRQRTRSSFISFLVEISG